ncbi:MAG: helix-turn-helix domain-containing protein [Anaerolineales bacterium]|nr:helix-turn-helix domain-containing protein [Anaerolineales bacterium]
MKELADYNVREMKCSIQILSCFDENNPERGVSETAKGVNRHNVTTHRIVQTLLSCGFLESTHDAEMYRLGVGPANIGARVNRRLNLREEALPYMIELQEKWGGDLRARHFYTGRNEHQDSTSGEVLSDNQGRCKPAFQRSLHSQRKADPCTHVSP